MNPFKQTTARCKLHFTKSQTGLRQTNQTVLLFYLHRFGPRQSADLPSKSYKMAFWPHLSSVDSAAEESIVHHLVLALLVILSKLVIIMAFTSRHTCPIAMTLPRCRCWMSPFSVIYSNAVIFQCRYQTEQQNNHIRTKIRRQPSRADSFNSLQYVYVLSVCRMTVGFVSCCEKVIAVLMLGWHCLVLSLSFQ